MSVGHACCVFLGLFLICCWLQAENWTLLRHRGRRFRRDATAMSVPTFCVASVEFRKRTSIKRSWQEISESTRSIAHTIALQQAHLLDDPHYNTHPILARQCASRVTPSKRIRTRMDEKDLYSLRNTSTSTLNIVKARLVHAITADADEQACSRLQPHRVATPVPVYRCAAAGGRPLVVIVPEASSTPSEQSCPASPGRDSTDSSGAQ